MWWKFDDDDDDDDDDSLPGLRDDLYRSLARPRRRNSATQTIAFFFFSLFSSLLQPKLLESSFKF